MRPIAPQSALHAAQGSGAELIGQLSNVLYVGAAVIFVAVMVLLLRAVIARGRDVSARRWVIGGGLVFPIVTLTALLVYSLAVGNALTAIGSTNALQLFLECFGIERAVARQDSPRPMRIHVVGKQWWWEVRYERADGGSIVLANELRFPIDEPVELVLSSSDVIHSFWAPSLAGKVDMIPGRTTQLHLRTSEIGRFRALCAEYCGGQHALMALMVVTQSRADFDAWLAAQARPAAIPEEDFMRRGYDAFFKGECQSCHTIRGTPANGALGPDLTHVGSRESLGAGILGNHAGTMAGWIAGSQDIKPGNHMPSLPLYTGEELRALATWLGSLK